MIRYNFDCVVDRHHTCATKIEEMEARFGHRDLLPFWIADMDFEACPAIIDALRQRLNHSVLGYTTPPESFWRSIAGWLHTRHGWDVDPAELSFMPGLKKGLGLCINYFSRPGDAIVIQPPVYHSFRSVIEGNGRRVAANPLVRDAAGQYSMDFEGLTRVMRDEHPAMMIVCNPHNPIGLQWDADTLRRVADICREHGVVLVSDEIYGDMMLGGRRHVPTASVSDVAADITVTLGAPSKTFNIPGIVSAWSVVRSPRLREGFYSWLNASEFNAPPIVSMVATQAAYEHGGDWLDQALAYLDANVDYAESFLRGHVPDVVLCRPQASFTMWLDFRRLRLPQDRLVRLLVERGHIALSDGLSFGPGGEGFMRMNVGVPRSILCEGLERLAGAVRSLSSEGAPAGERRTVTIPFVKMHGLGNNFIYVDCMDRSLDNLPALAVEMGRRHMGMGADGIIAILPGGEDADCRMRIFNADGSEAQMCGNGIRCAAKYIYDNNVVPRRSRLRIATLSGIKTVDIHTGPDGLTDSVRVDMGRPVFDAAEVPVRCDAGRMVDMPVPGIDGLRLTAVSTGNPHGVVFVDSFDGDIVTTLGPQLECHSIWPEKANIEFVRVDGRHSLSMRVWERGAGETMACGTGACAAAAAAVATGRADWPLTVRLIGGNLELDCDADGHILMTGPAVTVFSGNYYCR